MLKAYCEDRSMNNPSTPVSPERSIKGLLSKNREEKRQNSEMIATLLPTHFTKTKPTPTYLILFRLPEEGNFF